MVVIDFILLTALLLTDYFKSDPELWAYNETIMNAINQTQVKLQSLFAWFDYKTQFTGEVISLEYFLNNQYDPTLRRIYIDTFDDVSDMYLFNRVEADESIYVYNSSEYSNPTGPVNPLADPEQLYLYNETELENIATFTVFVPIGLVYNQIQMRADVDYYRVAGKTYQIVAI